MHRVESYVAGAWHRPSGDGRPLLDAATGEAVAELSPAGIDLASAVAYGRDTGGPALRELTFHQRASILRSVGKLLLADEAKEQLYNLSYCTGATRADSWIDIEGGGGVLMSYASKARRELPNSTVAVDGATEALSRDDSFSAVHILTARKGVELQINAFNFPVWGMLEKLAPAFIAGVPSIVKPASPTAYLAEAAARLIIGSGLMPEGSLQLACASSDELDNLLHSLDGQDSIAFTGSAATARALRAHPCVLERAVRLNVEADSLNAAVLAPAAAPGTGDKFYAHMDEEAAARSPIFNGLVAHGYLVLSFAAGLFVWPDEGPVLANYGIDRLRFAKPTYPGDEIHVVLTCKRKRKLDGRGYGEVAWDTKVVNQHGEVNAAYDVLTMVANAPGVNGAPEAGSHG